MLKILSVTTAQPELDADAVTLFANNPTITLRVEAPLYWWVDTDWDKHFFNMPTSNFKFCFDVGQEVLPLVKQLEFVLQNFYQPNAGYVVEERAVMQMLPLSTIVEGVIQLRYEKIVKICRNYTMGEYKYVKGYSFPNEREWKDFCETLLDIPGIRDLVEEVY